MRLTRSAALRGATPRPRQLAAPLLVVALAACIVPLRRKPLPRGLEGANHSSLTLKRVVDKESPVSLIADDGSRCVVPGPVYAKTDVGDTKLCVWRERDGRATGHGGGVGQPTQELSSPSAQARGSTNLPPSRARP